MGMKWLRISAVLIWAVSLPGAAAAASPMTLAVTPAQLDMGARFDGTQLTVSGSVPEGSELVLRFTGAPAELHMREKGKVFGLLWMNKEIVTFSNVPRVCLVETSKTFNELGPAAEPFGLDKLREALALEENTGSRDFDARSELLRLKKREGLCNETVGGIQFGAAKDGMQSFTAQLRVPSSLAPGNYQVEAVALKEGSVVGQASEPVPAKLVGLPAWLNSLAYKHGTLYGVLATVIAILGGLLIGVFFQSKGAH